MKRFTKNLIVYIVLFAVVLGVAGVYRGMNNDGTEVKKVALSTFIEYLEDEKIKEINVTDTKLTGKLNEKKVVYTYADK